MAVGIEISGEERDALYERIVLRLNGVDAVYRAVEAEDWEATQRLGVEFSDLLRFVCDDLGWGKRVCQTLTLGAPPDVLGRAAAVLRDAASFEREHHEGVRDEAAQDAAKARRLQETCERILDRLERG